MRNKRILRGIHAGIGVPCRDGDGHRTELVVTLDRERVVLGRPSGEVVVLTPLQAGRLRAAIRDLVVGPGVVGPGVVGPERAEGHR
ncbi:hypothetical protein CFN78_03225 [Amycolatopsis antarctica]|uniref:Uncharacterized protein n=1 Tax=Amycolatopsis antarctica TaxID=1854586 RepID=A0A263DCS5_9PSEU|nr:hypothetical protein [Amycolatopsis antarctica]OZM75185.1 hypothetical protein CFN78_03225 [Amycolatopsis antarctica]